MPAGPLDDPRLREVEACLNEGRFDEAQRKLVGLGGVRKLEPGVAYLTTRLLAQRGRLDSSAIAERMNDLLAEAPDFPEARNYLSSLKPLPEHDMARAPTLSSGLTPPSIGGAAQPRPAPGAAPYSSAQVTPHLPFSEPPTAPAVRSRVRPSALETPRVPGPGQVHLPPAARRQRSLPPELTLEPPRSELPTEPAPPPSEPLDLDAVRFEPESASAAGKGVWDPVELDLASGRVESALSALEKQAGHRLDQLVARRMPELETVAEHAADFLGGAPIVCHFPAFDLSIGSLARLDAALSLFARRPQRAPRYALSVLLSAYVGECVRRASNGTWHGRLAEPDMATIERPRGDPYLPWRAVHLAMTEGRPIRIGASVSLPHGSESGAHVRQPVDPPTAWDPEPWPGFALFQLIGRVVAGSALGTWAARIAQVPLDRSVGSLSAIDGYLALLASSVVTPEASGGWARRASVLTGAYVGEVLCLNAGARWSENEDAPFGPLRYELVTPDGAATYPVLWSLERLRGQGRTSIVERARAVLRG
jgi:hypothetical protein